MQKAIEIHDDVPMAWVESEWINTGRPYPSKDTPQCVLDARRRVLVIPQKYADCLPSPETSILLLLAMPLPSQDTDLIVPKGEALFSQLPPTEQLSAIRTRTLPSQSYLQALEASFSDQWFKGAQSIMDTRYTDSRLPLYGLTYWRQMAKARRSQRVWRMADEWMQRSSRDAVDKARNGLAVIAWGNQYRAFGAAVSLDIESLAIILSSGWYNDEHIDLFMAQAAEEVRCNPALARTTIIAGLGLAAVIASPVQQKQSKLLRRYTTCFKTGGCEHLLFPAHVNNNHWVAIEVNFRKREIAYGELHMCDRCLKC